MTVPDPLFRQRLRRHYADLKAIRRDLERGPAWFDCERAMSATARLYVSLYREAIDPMHSGPHPEG